MPDYVRAKVPGGTYFFTVKLAVPAAPLLTERIGNLRTAWGATGAELPFRTDAVVILPDHLHAVWTLPPGDADFPERWRRIKARFSRAVGRTAPWSASKRATRETGLWQRRYWEHAIRDEADFRMHVAYCWGNPVKHGLVARAAAWTFSSIHRDIRRGRVDPEWAGRVTEGEFGE